MEQSKDLFKARMDQRRRLDLPGKIPSAAGMIFEESIAYQVLKV